MVHGGTMTKNGCRVAYGGMGHVTVVSTVPALGLDASDCRLCTVRSEAQHRLASWLWACDRQGSRSRREIASVILMVDVAAAESDLAAGALACPGCGGRLRPWSWAPVRTIRRLDGTAVVRPRRTRCVTCHGTHLLLPSWCLPRRADAGEVIGTALLAHAAGASPPTWADPWAPCDAG
jgi:hypothetical protein